MEFVDTEQMAREFLRAKTFEQVELRVPHPRPQQFIQILRTGGTAVNRVLERAQLTIRGWGAHDFDAKQRTAAARHAFLHESSDMPLVRGVEEIQGLQSNPDPESGHDRWEFTIQLMARATR